MHHEDAYSWSKYLKTNFLLKDQFRKKYKYILQNDEYLGETLYSKSVDLDNGENIKIILEPKLLKLKAQMAKQLQDLVYGFIFLILLSLPLAYFFSLLPTRLESQVKELNEELKNKVNKKIKELENLNKNLENMVTEKVTQVRQKDNLLIKQSRQAAMGEMIGNIAHQWRQPLNALSLTVQKIKIFHDNEMLTSEKLNKAVEKSTMLINKMSTTIDDFRNFFRTDKVKEKFQLIDAINETLELLEASLRHNNIDINMIEDKSIILLGYKNELEQVLLNIINNAKDAMIENSTPIPKIEIKTFITNNDINIEISDNAGGIPKDIIDKIFDPYFTTKEQGKGTGIGLYMSKMIIETNMDGKIHVENSDYGAIFTIKIKRDNS